jgi:hypothetical protein
MNNSDEVKGPELGEDDGEERAVASAAGASP